MAATNGTYTWTVTAIDTAGNSTTAPSQLYIINKEPPTIGTVSVYPMLPVYNTGYLQLFNVDGSSDKYPVRVEIHIMNAS